LQFNIIPPPPSITTTSVAISDTSKQATTNVSTSELSLVINKAESIDDKECEMRESLEDVKTNDEIIEEVISIPVVCERRVSLAERQKSAEVQDMVIDNRLPASISTQTIPTEEFPESTSSVNIINQSDSGGTIELVSVAQSEPIREQLATERSEIERKVKEIKREKSRSIDEKERKASRSGGASLEEEKCCKLTHQQSQASQEEDFEIAMVTGLVPGCVGK
jgi:hypothetical protein